MRTKEDIQNARNFLFAIAAHGDDSDETKQKMSVAGWALNWALGIDFALIDDAVADFEQMFKLVEEAKKARDHSSDDREDE